MYHTRRTTFPRNQTVEVPHYQMRAFDGRSLVLVQEPRCLKVDVTALDARAIACVTDVLHEGGEIRGLIAVDAMLFATVFQLAMNDENSPGLGALLEEAWYLLAPIEWQRHVPVRAGESVLVGLYR
ncbi:hypothetical protein [Deinococcus sp. QL22]|uniref:hypothetical protein n=1 Tax=Deinococcus sp. QL22 TaxID=2939437 RepID=UPI0020170B3B|nr:hypothetical protein [Deinococcus sp. QL22]UQN10680.1 hypothetical protein M1R55_30355 [Deinococcus sp. QL22]